MVNFSALTGLGTWQKAIALVGIAIAFYILTELLLVFYRLTSHPLARFPGSKLAAASKWYEFYYDICKGEGGQYAWEMQKMHEKYGPIIRINPDELHIADPNYFDTIYAPIPARRDKYGPAANMIGCPLGSFGTEEHQIHRKRRAANSILFSGKHVATSIELIHSRLDLLYEALASASQTEKVLHLQTELLAFTTDLLTTWVLDKPMGCQTDHSIAELWERTTRSLPRVTPIVKQFPWIIKLVLKLPESLIFALAPNIAYVATIHKDMHKEARLHAERRHTIDTPSKREFLRNDQRLTVFQAIDISDLPEHEKSIERQAQEAFVLISAGAETTARTMTSCMFQLADDPKSFERLRNELRTVMPNVSDRPSLKSLESLPFFTAVLKENLRTMQLITSRFPLIADKSLQFQQWTIPAGTPISMTINEILSDGSIYPEPDMFKPERWLDSQGKLHDDLQPWFMPFGRGTRMCAGQNVAWAVMYLTIAGLVRRFDFELYETTRARDFVITRDCFFGTTTESSAGIRMRVTKDLLNDE